MTHARAAALVGVCLLLPVPAAAEAIGIASLALMPGPNPGSNPGLPPSGIAWEGAYARLSTGFQVTSSKRFGTFAGPTIGVEGGRMWRDGSLVFGAFGAFEATKPLGGYTNPGFGEVAWTRDFAATAQLKAGVLAADNVLVYGRLGAAAMNETLRYGPGARSAPFSRSDVVVRPGAGVGVEWAITPRLTVGIEAGVVGAPLR